MTDEDEPRRTGSLRRGTLSRTRIAFYTLGGTRSIFDCVAASAADAATVAPRVRAPFRKGTHAVAMRLNRAQWSKIPPRGGGVAPPYATPAHRGWGKVLNDFRFLVGQLS